MVSIWRENLNILILKIWEGKTRHSFGDLIDWILGFDFIFTEYEDEKKESNQLLNKIHLIFLADAIKHILLAISV